MIAWVLRVVVAAGLLGSAWVHYVLWRDGFSGISVVGPLFLVNAVAGLVIAAAVLLWRHWLPALAALGFGAATLGAYLLSVTVGFFGVQEQFVTQAEVWGVVTEAACVVFGFALLFFRERRPT
ncbi:hypothetical protein [Amycolatopsis sp. H20-H5]|uniref:hypothetical protein n=1 Tax=Amycolatopsis sp. H20-H5 TaxID=3046309 RepID=UPI002DBDC0B5|nr:hypothetical protein [Amycolatopsis sp. H20-H5]MEC3980977.1 hypothetical protein [Amycolatopsis sp. H20-H5]